MLDSNALWLFHFKGAEGRTLLLVWAGPGWGLGLVEAGKQPVPYVPLRRAMWLGLVCWSDALAGVAGIGVLGRGA